MFAAWDSGAKVRRVAQESRGQGVVSPVCLATSGHVWHAGGMQLAWSCGQAGGVGVGLGVGIEEARGEGAWRTALAPVPDDNCTNGDIGDIGVNSDKPADARRKLQDANSPGSLHVSGRHCVSDSQKSSGSFESCRRRHAALVPVIPCYRLCSEGKWLAEKLGQSGRYGRCDAIVG